MPRYKVMVMKVDVAETDITVSAANAEKASEKALMLARQAKFDRFADTDYEIEDVETLRKENKRAKED